MHALVNPEENPVFRAGRMRESSPRPRHRRLRARDALKIFARWHLVNMVVKPRIIIPALGSPEVRRGKCFVDDEADAAASDTGAAWNADPLIGQLISLRDAQWSTSPKCKSSVRRRRRQTRLLLFSSAFE